MIHFTIKFLICLTKPKPPLQKGNKKKTPKSPSSGKPSTVLSKNSVPNEENIAQGMKKIIQCPEKAREWCHIEYCLFDDVLPTVEVTVVTWGGAAKIYTEDDCRALETVIMDDCVWVHFSMVHKISKLNDEQVDFMKENVITFIFSQDQTKMKAKIANDWPKTFVVCNCKDSEETEKIKWFSKLRQSDPPDDSHYSKARLENYTMKHEKSTKHMLLASMLNLISCDRIIEKKIIEVMKSMSTSTSAEKYAVSNLKKNKKKVTRESNKEKSEKLRKIRSNSSSQEKSKLFLRSGLLIAGKTNVCVESEGISSSLRYAATFTSASKMLTEEQDFSFLPLSVTVEEVENIPMVYLEDLNIDSVYARYELAPLFEARTSKVSVKRGGGASCHAEFDDTQLWFISDPRERGRYEQLTQRPSVLMLIESLQTRRLVVKLFGARRPGERPVEPCIYGSRPDDQFISTPGHPMFTRFKDAKESKDVLLGSACFNLVQLAKGRPTLEASAPLGAAPASSWNLACDWEELTEDVRSADKRAELADALEAGGEIPGHELMRHFTSVKIKVALGWPVGNVPEKELILIPDVFHKVIVVFKNYSYACAVVERITSANQTVADLSANTSVTSGSVSNLALRYACESLAGDGGGSAAARGGSRAFSPSSLGSRRTLASIRRGLGLTSSVVQQIKEFRRMLSCSHRAITGFFVKHAEQSLLVLESIPYVTTYVMEPLHGMAADLGSVVYDNSVFFGRRLYGGLERHVLVVEPAESLDALLARSGPRLLGATRAGRDRARVAARALLLLDRLRRAPTVNDAAVDQLFPSADQLLAFQSEYADGRSSSTASGESSGPPLRFNSLAL